MIIRKVWLKKKTNQLMLSIPQKQGIDVGDHVRIEKVNINEDKNK